MCVYVTVCVWCVFCGCVVCTGRCACVGGMCDVWYICMMCVWWIVYGGCVCTGVCVLCNVFLSCVLRGVWCLFVCDLCFVCV